MKEYNRVLVVECVCVWTGGCCVLSIGLKGWPGRVNVARV